MNNEDSNLTKLTAEEEISDCFVYNSIVYLCNLFSYCCCVDVVVVFRCLGGGGCFFIVVVFLFAGLNFILFIHYKTNTNNTVITT